MMKTRLPQSNRLSISLSAIAAIVAIGSWPGVASASFFQENCSSADTTTQVRSGHLENLLKVTQRQHLSGEAVDKVLDLDQREYVVNIGKETEVIKEKKRHCNPGDRGGWVSWHSVYARQIEIRRFDGGILHEDLVGRSQDGQSVQAIVLCDLTGNGQILCEPPTP